MVEVRIQVWDAEEIARWAAKLERVAETPHRPHGFARWALELAKSLRNAGAALAFVDEDDADAVFDVLTRLDTLQKDAEHLLERLAPAAAEEVTVVRSVTSSDDAVTTVMSLAAQGASSSASRISK